MFVAEVRSCVTWFLAMKKGLKAHIVVPHPPLVMCPIVCETLSSSVELMPTGWASFPKVFVSFDLTTSHGFFTPIFSCFFTQHHQLLSDALKPLRRTLRVIIGCLIYCIDSWSTDLLRLYRLFFWLCPPPIFLFNMNVECKRSPWGSKRKGRPFSCSMQIPKQISGARR